MDWLNYTLFTFNGDTPVLLIDLITSIAGLTCVFLAGRNSKSNFWVGYVYSALLFLMFWNKALWANMLLQPISLGINILGHYRWTHPKPEEVSEKDGRSLKVSMLSWPQRAVSVAAIFALGWLWGWLLETLTHDPQEMGLLGGMAGSEHHPDHPAHIRRARIHADSLCPLPDKRCGLHHQLVAPLP